MDIRQITTDFAVSDQLTANDVAQAHSLGFQSIICNRPDGEDIAQPLFESIAAAAATTHIMARYVPVQTTGPSPDDVTAFAAAYHALPKPVLAYCRTGTRSAMIFDLAFPNGT